MTIVLALLALQAASPPQSHSILIPDCAAKPGDDIVVCARPKDAERLPLPQERAPVGPLPIEGAAQRMVDPTPRPLGGTPCGATQWGCQVGIGPSPAMVRAVAGAAAGLLRGLTAKKVDKSGRIAIPMEDPPAAR